MADEAPVPSVRASDAEREGTILRLRDAAGEGRLTFEELSDRVDAAAAAVTRDELDRLTADLPAGRAVAPVPRPAPDPAAPVPTHGSSVFGDVRRTGRWVVPARGRWTTTFGDVVLDLREATVTAAETHVDARTVFGDVQLFVPEGVEVEVRARTVFGDVRQETGEAGARGAPRIVLTGGTVFGDVRVQTRRLRERLAARLTR